MKKTSFSLWLGAILLTTHTSCATLFAPVSHPLAMNSDPAGSEVFLNGQKIGSTPIQLQLKADKTYTIEFKKDGFEPITKVVNTKVGAGWIFLDILFWPAIIVDASTGKWKKLDQNAVDAVLLQQQTSGI